MKKIGLIPLYLMAFAVTINAAPIRNTNLGNPPACQQPSRIRTIAVTDSSATLVWHGDAERYDYIHVSKANAAALNIISEGEYIDDTTVSLGNLRPNTVYCFKVRGHCGRNSSQWSPMFEFRTQNSTTVSNGGSSTGGHLSQKGQAKPVRLPYKENFEKCGVGTSPTLPSGWEAFCRRSDTDSLLAITAYVRATDKHVIQGKRSLALMVDAMRSDSTLRMQGYAVLPIFSVTDKQYLLSFDGRSASGSGLKVVVGLVDVVGEVSTLVPLHTYAFGVKKEHYEIPFEKGQLDKRHIVLCCLGSDIMPGGGHDTAIIDNITLAPPSEPRCPIPFGIKMEESTSTSATITWNGTYDQYEVKWKNAEGLQQVRVSGNSFVINELEPNTRYLVQVRTICDDSHTSNWAYHYVNTQPEREDPISCQVPVNLHVVKVGMYNVTLDWTPVGTEKSWVVKMWNKNHTWTKTAEEHPFTFGTDARSDIMRESDDLRRCEEYNVAVHPICDMGWNYVPQEYWEYSQPVTFKSQCCPDVKNLRVGRVRENAVFLEWEGRTNNYDIIYADITDPNLEPIWEKGEYNSKAGTFPDPNGPRTLSFWFDELEPYRKYEIGLCSKCEDGNMGEYAKVIVETPPYILTEAGVDILQIGKPFIEKPPKGSIYDKVVKTSCITEGEEEITYYELYKGNIFVGEAVLGGRQRLMYFNLLKVDNVALKGEIPNTPIEVLFNKEGVVISPGTINPMNSEGNITIKYNNSVQIIVPHDALSPKGKEKFRRLLNEQNSSYSSGTVAPYSVDVQRDDFKPGITIMKYSCMYGDNNGSHEMCDPWSIGSDLEI